MYQRGNGLFPFRISALTIIVVITVISCHSRETAEKSIRPNAVIRVFFATTHERAEKLRPKATATRAPKRKQLAWASNTIFFLFFFLVHKQRSSTDSQRIVTATKKNKERSTSATASADRFANEPFACTHFYTCSRRTVHTTRIGHSGENQKFSLKLYRVRRRSRLIFPSRFVVFQQYTSSNNSRIPAASSPANTNNSSSSSSNTNGGTSLQSSNQPTTSSPSSETATPAQQLSKTNLYIRGLGQNTTDKDLITMCSQ